MLNVTSGHYGSVPNLALFIAALCVGLCLLPAGAPLAILLTIRDLRAFSQVSFEGAPNWLIHDLIGFSVAAIAAYSLEKTVIRARSAILRAGVITALTFLALAIVLGVLQWFAGGDSPILLALGISVAALLFLLFCTCRNVFQLVIYGRHYPAFAIKIPAYGLAGSATLVTAAAYVAWLSGADLLKLDDTHSFYILTVPAVAGFGLFSPKPPARSRVVAGISLLAFAGLLFYSWPLPFLRHARMECDWYYEKPHHVLFGFEGAPWDWESGYYLSNWVGAPAALGELTLSYITQPLLGLTCEDELDLEAR